MAEPHRLALRGDVLHFVAEPDEGEAGEAAARFEPEGWLRIEDGRVVAIDPADRPPGPEWQREDWRGHLLMPGFVDIHLHAPQLEVMGSHADGLFDWLARHTFPAEARWADPGFATASAERFVRALLAHGTTAAMVFATAHAHGVDAVFHAARRRGMRLIAGRVLMDTGPGAGQAWAGAADRPQAQGESAAARAAELERGLIARWHGVDRLAYAVTPRFAPACSPELLRHAAALLGERPGLYLQTHVAETRDEAAAAAVLHPGGGGELAVLDAHGLLGPRSVLGHAVWLGDAELARVAETGATVAFCPSSNLFLGSGLFDWDRACRAGVGVAPASDVGAGTSLCPLRTLADAFRVEALQGRRPTAWTLLHAATRGAAVRLGLEAEIGGLRPGAAADVAVWRWAEGEVQQRRQDLARSLHERLFAWILLGDERNLAAVYVAGRRVDSEPEPALDVGAGALGV